MKSLIKHLMKWYVLISRNYQCDYACVYLFTSQESTLLSPQCSLKGWTATLFLPPTVHACMCLCVVCLSRDQPQKLSHHSEPSCILGIGCPANQSFCLALDLYSHSHTYTLTHTHRLRGTPDSLKNESVFRPSRYKAFVRRSNCQAERNPRPSSLCVQNSNDFIIGVYE